MNARLVTPLRTATLALATLATFSFTAQPALAAPPAAPATAISPDSPAYPFTNPNPEAEIGKLPNGLTYGVMQRGGTRRVSIILMIGAGSQDETDQERGVAHFLEHMAFNGSTHFPPGEVLKRFADIGVAIGRDQNAETTFDSTTFSLDIPEVTPDKLDLSFSWLRDVADGSSIDPAQVNRERGVIMSEYIGSRSAMGDLAQASETFLAPNLLGPQRAPIGLKDIITNVDAQTIRGFYERWYRPETSIVVAVGDLPRDELKARIIQAFGSWHNDRPAPPKPNLGRINPSRPSAVLTRAEDRAPPTLEVCRLEDKDADEREGVASRTRDFEEALWQSTLDKRLTALATSANPPFLGPEVARQELFDAADASCVDAPLRDGNWRSALTAISTEMRRLAIHGLTEDEYQAGRKALVAQVEAEVGQAPTMTGAQLAQSIVANLTTHGTFSTAEEDQRIGRLALTNLTRDKVNAEFGRVWTHAGKPLIVLITSKDQPGAAVLHDWRVAEASPPPAAPAAHQGTAWAYSNFGPPGEVVSRIPLADIGAERIEFANGVRLNFKSSQNAQDRVEIRIRFGAGQEELAAADLPAARLGASLLRQGGLGKNDFGDTVRLCDGHACSLDLSVQRDTFEIAGATRPSDLDIEMQLITAYLSDPGFRPEVDAQIPTSVRTLYQMTRSEPSFVAAEARNDAMPAPRIPLLPPESTLEGVRSTDFARILGPALKHDALEVTIVGDIDETTAVAAVARTLGALPPRQWRDTTLPGAPHMHYSDPSPPQVLATHDGSPEKATVLATWPLFVWTPDKEREKRTLELLAEIVQGQAIDDIRQRLGKAYTPEVSVDLNRGGDQGALTVAIDTSPAATEIVVGELKKIAAQLAAGGITTDMLERVRRPLLDDGATREISNPWWIDMLDGSWAHPDQLASARSWESDYETITLDEVKAEAHRWLTPAPLMVVASPSVQAANTTTRPGG
ncbi:MAG TPA: insulinase family protein [Caulobacteraceae bacterium]|jgi:zinc protease|nr:insulinase family protein [Caulobacteraceae bacterium]